MNTYENIALRLEILELQAKYTALSCEYQARLFNLAYFLNSEFASLVLAHPGKLAELEGSNQEMLVALNKLGLEINQKMKRLHNCIRLQRQFYEWRN